MAAAEVAANAIQGVHGKRFTYDSASVELCEHHFFHTNSGTSTLYIQHML